MGSGVRGANFVWIVAIAVLAGFILWLCIAGPSHGLRVALLCGCVALLWALVVASWVLTSSRSRTEPDRRRRAIVGGGLLLAALLFIPAAQASTFASWQTVLFSYLGSIAVIGLGVLVLFGASARLANLFGLGVHSGPRTPLEPARYRDLPILAARPLPGDMPPMADAEALVDAVALSRALASRLSGLDIADGRLALVVLDVERGIAVSLGDQSVAISLPLERHRLLDPSEAARRACLSALSDFQALVVSVVGEPWPTGHESPVPPGADFVLPSEVLKLSSPVAFCSLEARTLALGWSDELGPVVTLEPIELSAVIRH